MTVPDAQFLASLEAGRASKRAQVIEQVANATSLTPTDAGQVIADLLSAGFQIQTPGSVFNGRTWAGTSLNSLFRERRP